MKKKYKIEEKRPKKIKKVREMKQKRKYKLKSIFYLY